ncbi:unnamed protein product, partial [Ixodes hexagonus]
MRTREHGRQWAALLPVVGLLVECLFVGGGQCAPAPPRVQVNGTASLDANREWESVHRKFSVIVNGVLDQALPDLTKTVFGLELSPDCLLSLLRVVNGARKMDLDSIRMLDATSKLPSGILEGSVADLGDYDQCLAIRVRNRFDEDVEDFRGCYCGLALQMPLPPKPEVIGKNVLTIDPDIFPKS